MVGFEGRGGMGLDGWLDTQGPHAAEELVGSDTTKQLSKDVWDKVSALNLLRHPHPHCYGRVECAATDRTTEQDGQCEGRSNRIRVSSGQDHIYKGKCADELNDKLLHLIVETYKKLNDPEGVDITSSPVWLLSCMYRVAHNA